MALQELISDALRTFADIEVEGKKVNKETNEVKLSQEQIHALEQLANQSFS